MRCFGQGFTGELRRHAHIQRLEPAPRKASGTAIGEEARTEADGRLIEGPGHDQEVPLTPYATPIRRSWR